MRSETLYTLFDLFYYEIYFIIELLLKFMTKIHSLLTLYLSTCDYSCRLSVKRNWKSAVFRELGVLRHDFVVFVIYPL